MELTVIVMMLSLVIGLVVALARLSRLKTLRTVATFYVEVIRGTPCMLQLFYIYFVLPAFGIKIGPFAAGVVGLTVNYAAYLSEVYRAGIQAVAKGQVEAALSLGMSRAKMMRLVILPQAIRIVVPPLGNYFISLFKDTALASTITVKELIFSGQIIAATNFQYFTIFTIAGMIYLGAVLSRIARRAVPRAADAHRVPAPRAGASERRPGGDVVIRLDRVNKSFGRLHVLRDVSLTVEKGEVVCIIGPSGAGSRRCCAASTISKGSTAGQSTWRSEPVYRYSKNGKIVVDAERRVEELRSEVGMVFQSFNLFPHLTAIENVMLAPVHVRREPREDARRKARHSWRRLGFRTRWTPIPRS